MLFAPKIPHFKHGDILTSNSVNHIIKRIEYGAELLKKLEESPENIIRGVTDWVGLYEPFLGGIITIYNRGAYYEIKRNSNRVISSFKYIENSFRVLCIHESKIGGSFRATQGSKTNRIGFIYDYINQSTRYFNFDSGDRANNDTQIWGIYGNNYFGTRYDNRKYGTYYFTNTASYPSDGPYFISIYGVYGSTFIGDREYNPEIVVRIIRGWQNGKIINYPGAENTLLQFAGPYFSIGYYGEENQSINNPFVYSGGGFYSLNNFFIKIPIEGEIILNEFLLSSRYINIDSITDPRYPPANNYFYDYIDNRIISLKNLSGEVVMPPQFISL